MRGGGLPDCFRRISRAGRRGEEQGGQEHDGAEVHAASIPPLAWNVQPKAQVCSETHSIQLATDPIGWGRIDEKVFRPNRPRVHAD